MAKNLIVVESPAKTRTLSRYLGKDFEALASYGHVRDLEKKEGVIPDEDFRMTYGLIERNKKHVDAIEKALRRADALYLATDPDREGEAISWHLYEELKARGALDGKPVHRVVFYEITKSAIKEAIESPRTLSQPLVEAQQARRALDYLVGFNLSPILWKKVRRGLSAGRVQSPALRLICEREEEIKAFKAREYWTLEADLVANEQAFEARLIRLRGEKLEQFSITTEDQASDALRYLEAESGDSLVVHEIKTKQRRRYASPPFTTSTLQQEASRKLGFGAQRTMRTAQQLYEGVDLDGSRVGLITYMRTDSVALAREAVAGIRDYIAEQYGAENLPEKPNHYKNRSKNAQEAHEAIRPSAITRTPKEVSKYLDSDQRKLYELIWKRALASQMIYATLDTVTLDLRAGSSDNLFRATGSTIVHPGFIAVYTEGEDEQKKQGKTESRLPKVDENEKIASTLRKEQHFTEPPPRYTEASLVKSLEAFGIGRPSTYASIISTLQQREYVEIEQRRFFPTDVGLVVNQFLTSHFATYVDYDFTARLEDELDEISRGESDWRPVMEQFWQKLKQSLEGSDDLPRGGVPPRAIGADPRTGKEVTVRMGPYGAYVQIGESDDDVKPLRASLPPGQKMDSIDLDQALALFKLPRILGETPEGEPVSANIGRYGPYVKYGEKKFVSLEEEDPHTVTLERALQLIEEKKAFDANRIIHDFDNGRIQVLRGRYGPYVTDGKKNARIPKDQAPESLDLNACEALLASAPVRRKKKTARRKAKSKA